MVLPRVTHMACGLEHSRMTGKQNLALQLISHCSRMSHFLSSHISALLSLSGLMKAAQLGARAHLCGHQESPASHSSRPEQL